MLEKFIKYFCSEKIEYLQKGNKFFLTNNQLNTIAKNLNNVVSEGVLFGEIKNNVFFPNLYLLDWLSKRTNKKVTVTDKAAWLFLCGRDILRESIININTLNKKANDFVLVQNKFDENLGYGKITKTGIKCVLDRGDYLRRERKSSRVR